MNVGKSVHKRQYHPVPKRAVNPDINRIKIVKQNIGSGLAPTKI